MKTVVCLISGVSMICSVALLNQASCTAHTAVKLSNCLDFVHLEQEGANYKLIYIYLPC